MGIRVHKVLGYGLTDVRRDKDGRIRDGRINSKAVGEVWDRPVEPYLKWIRIKSDERREREGEFARFNMDLWLKEDALREKHIHDMSDAVIWVGEPYALDVLLLKPLSCTDWFRFDDTIDYVEETYIRGKNDEVQRDRVEILEHGIFPYNGSYMNAKTGEPIKDGIRWVQYHWPSFQKLQLDYDKLAKEMGFENEDDANENFAPIVPQEIRDIAEYLKLFKKPDVWMQLRPMLYTYWR